MILVLGRKSLTNLDNILKKAESLIANKGLYSQRYVFPVVMYGCRAGPKRRLSAKELMLLNCGVGDGS